MTAGAKAIVPKTVENELRDGAEFSPELDQLMRKARKETGFLKALSHENRLLQPGDGRCEKHHQRHLRHFLPHPRGDGIPMTRATSSHDPT